MKFYSEKIINLVNADVHLHYANNKGRGRDNVTLTFVKPGTERKSNANKYNYDYIKQYRVSGWAGVVNVPTADIEKFGGVK